MSEAMKKTAAEMRLLPDLRRMRVGAVLHRVMRVIDPFIEHDDRHRVFDRLFELFMQEGVEVLTDATRAELGLAARDGEGWTEPKLRIYDAIRLQKMLETIKFTIPPKP